MSNKDIRSTLLYILGILGLIALVFVAISYVSENGIGFLGGNNAGKSYEQPPEMSLEEGVDYKARVTTNYGEFTMDLFEENAPMTVNNFVFLAEDNFYQGVTVHRLIQDFIIQTGSPLSLDNDPSNDGVGGPGYRFEDEVNWESLDLTEEQISALESAGFASDDSVESVPLAKYRVAMANAGPNTNGSQFFIVTANQDDPSIQNLQGRHTVFGEVTEGKEVIDELNDVELINANTSSPRPAEEVVIENIEIIKE